MARDGQVLPPVPAPGSKTLCRIVLSSIVSPELRKGNGGNRQPGWNADHVNKGQGGNRDQQSRAETGCRAAGCAA